MGLKVPSASLQWSQPSVSQPPPSSSQALASSKPSPFSTPSLRRSVSMCDIYGSAFFGAQKPSKKLHKSQSCENLRSHVVRRALSAGLGSLPDDEFDKDIQESDNIFQLYEENANGSGEDQSFEVYGSMGEFNSFPKKAKLFGGDEIIITPNIERVANSLGIPFSLRMIKHKKQWLEGFVEAGENSYCSVRKAFSSMVFIIRELHSYTLHMREILFYEDLQGIISQVHKEMNASFVWLFQKIFSQTPNLMVCLMILLANYSVYSMSINPAIAASPAQPCTISSSMVENEGFVDEKFESLAVKNLKSSSGKTASIGGNNGGGGKFRKTASGTEDNDRSDRYADVIGSSGNLSEAVGEDSVGKNLSPDEETSVWESMVHEARKMQADTSDEALDHETVLRFVSPVDAKVEAEDSSKYFRTDFSYQIGLARDPNNPLLLANYAQFLYLVSRDYDSAEEYFKRAVRAEPKDAESFFKYANFLWLVRKDLWLAEEKYLEAMDEEPENSYYSGSYAHFLLSSGGEDTCIL